MPIESPFSSEKSKERSLRKGRAFVEIIRAHYENFKLDNQKDLRNRILKHFDKEPTGGVLAADVDQLEKEGWIAKQGNSLLLAKKDYEIIADSWCAQALYISAELTNARGQFSLPAWRDRAIALLLSLGEISETRAGEKCQEFLIEYSDCGYVRGDLDAAEGVAFFDVATWNRDQFYLLVARESSLHRPFEKRAKSPGRKRKHSLAKLPAPASVRKHAPSQKKKGRKRKRPK